MTVPGWTELRGDQTPPLYTGAGVPRSLHPPTPTPHRVTGVGEEMKVETRVFNYSKYECHF